LFVSRKREAGGLLLQQVFCLIEFGAVRGAFAELLIEESLLHVAGFGGSLRLNRGEKNDRTVEPKSRSLDYDPRPSRKSGTGDKNARVSARDDSVCLKRGQEEGTSWTPAVREKVGRN